MNKDKYSINYLPSAEKDINEIISYIQSEDPKAALNLLNNTDDSVSQLKSFPFKGKKPGDDYLRSKGYRMLIVNNYIIFLLCLKKKMKLK